MNEQDLQAFFYKYADLGDADSYKYRPSPNRYFFNSFFIENSNFRQRNEHIYIKLFTLLAFALIIYSV